MNLHEQIDRALAWSGRTKFIVFLSICLFIGLIAGLIFWEGVKYSRQWEDSKYLEQLKQKDAQIAQFEADAARHESNETQLSAENSLLRKQNEATAEILAQRDKNQAASDARKFTDLANQRNKTYEDIDADSNYDSQLCGLCTDAERAGHALSQSLCGRCKNHP